MAQSKLFNEKTAQGNLNAFLDKATDIVSIATRYKFIPILMFLKRRISNVWKLCCLLLKKLGLR